MDLDITDEDPTEDDLVLLLSVLLGVLASIDELLESLLYPRNTSDLICIGLSFPPSIASSTRSSNVTHLW